MGQSYSSQSSDQIQSEHFQPVILPLFEEKTHQSLSEGTMVQEISEQDILVENITKQIEVETICKITENTLVKRIKVLECRNKILSELLKAEASNYDSLKKLTDDLLLENQMLRKSNVKKIDWRQKIM